VRGVPNVSTTTAMYSCSYYRTEFFPPKFVTDLPIHWLVVLSILVNVQANPVGGRLLVSCSLRIEYVGLVGASPLDNEGRLKAAAMSGGITVRAS
jgi:hypothetical protein